MTIPTGDLNSIFADVIAKLPTGTHFQVGERHLKEIKTPNEVIFVPGNEDYLPRKGQVGDATTPGIPRTLWVREVTITAYLFVASLNAAGTQDTQASDTKHLDACEDFLNRFISAIHSQVWSHFYRLRGGKWNRADGELQKCGFEYELTFIVQIAVKQITDDFAVTPITELDNAGSIGTGDDEPVDFNVGPILVGP